MREEGERTTGARAADAAPDAPDRRSPRGAEGASVGAAGEHRRPSDDGLAATARETKDEVKAKAGELKEEASSRVRDAKEDVKVKAREVRDEAEERADRWTSSLGERVNSLARALSAAADSLRHEGEGAMADMAGKAAERVERMSGYLDDEDPSAMVEDLENLGRRNPGAFVGSAFATGLAAGRFLRASRPARTDGPSRARATTMPTEKPGASWPREHEPPAGREAQARARPPATGERTLPATSGVPATGGEE